MLDINKLNSCPVCKKLIETYTGKIEIIKWCNKYRCFSVYFDINKNINHIYYNGISNYEFVSSKQILDESLNRIDFTRIKCGEKILVAIPQFILPESFETKDLIKLTDRLLDLVIYS